MRILIADDNPLYLCALGGTLTEWRYDVITARAVEAKSPFADGHADRVTQYALALAHAVGLPRDQHELLRRGSLLHDIGKISIPDAILNKPGPLTEAEMELIKEHPAQGVNIIEPLESLRDVIPLIRWHHERLDGRRYPDGLRGEAVPFLVRILSVADFYDSLASERPYGPALAHGHCVDILQAHPATSGL